MPQAKVGRGMAAFLVLGAVVAISVASPAEPSKESASISEPQVDGSVSERASGEAGGTAPAPGEEALRALVASCDQALGEGSCVPFQAGAREPYFAEVSFELEAARVVLRTSGSEQQAVVAERSLSFSEADGRPQRQRAAGLLVAAMTAAADLAQRQELEAAEKEEELLVAAPAPPVSPPPPAPAPRREGAPFGAEAAFVTSPLLGPEGWGFGGLFNLGFWPRDAFAFNAEARMLRATGEELSGDSISGALGATLVLGRRNAAFGLRVHPQAVFESTRVFGVVPEGGAKFAHRGGGRLGVSVAWGGHLLAPFALVSVTALAPAVSVERDGEHLRTLPPVTLSLAFGVRLEP